MEIEFKFLPPSANQMYRVGRGRMYKSKKYVEFDKKMATLLKGCGKIEGHVGIEIDFHMKRKNKDLDNMLKALIDSLEHRVIENDSNVFEIHARKHIGKVDSTSIKIYQSSEASTLMHSAISSSEYSSAASM
jgi:Holliday junction resolvase RusA-like endonuclease